MADEPRKYVSRAAEKLLAALNAFDVDVRQFVCADLGCNVGGFTQVLLERGAEKVYAVDTGWTRQKHILPAAARLLKPGARIITLVKPHYEAPPKWLRKGVLLPERRDEVIETTRSDTHSLGLRILASVDSPLPGQSGNIEQLWLVGPD